MIELTELVDLSSFPSGTRLIVRREPLHPGAQQSLFPSLEHRYWGLYTDQAGDPVALDAFIRAHAYVEQHIARLKDSGLCRFPFSNLQANRSWLMVVAAAADLVRWFQLLCCDVELAGARPKQLRWTIFHAPGRLVRSARRNFVRILEGWPSAEAIIAIYRRIALITRASPHPGGSATRGDLTSPFWSPAAPTGQRARFATDQSRESPESHDPRLEERSRWPLQHSRE